ncbi:MAG TPA: acyl-CoA thioesterase [Holophagaceae bacterium]|nr:acyl-CoA thioesterase [Holophagaceae bacterium]
MSKTRDHSRSILSVTVLPEDLNQYGSLFGGRLLSWIDRLASICATRHCRGNAVTVALDAMSFDVAVKQADILTLTAVLEKVGRTSMQIRVTAMREDPTTGDAKRVCAPLLTFVALDRDGHPTPVPALSE